uniref:DDE Tnp4 domain-containing protein n=1 Tax=Chenopodium quinoa TaxID=63459 RepID=A0A803LBP0_CHEQI
MAPNNKRVNDETEGGVNRANWSKETLHVFCDLCIKFAVRSKGKRGSTTSQRMPWKENAHYKAFQDEGIDPDLELKMDQLFGVLVAQGVHRFTPVQIEKEDVYIPSPPSVNVGDVPFQYDDEMSENEAFNNIQSRREWQEVWNDNASIPSPSPTSHSPTPPCDEFTRRGSKRVLEFTERNMKDVELMNLESQKLDSSSSSVADSLAKLVLLPGLIPGSQEFCFACTLIEDPQKRIILDGMDLHVKRNAIRKRRRNNLFWDSVACALGYISLYYVKYIHKEPCFTSYRTGERWIHEILNGHEKRCFNMFRMTKNTFRQLAFDLENKYGLLPSERMSTLEKLGIFLYVLSIGASNREAQERFQHSGETISRVFKEVLDATQGLSRDILRPRDPEFKEIPNQIANDTRYMPYFKDCIGAIDGTHIDVIVPEEDQLRYRGRKGTPTLNVLAACDFDLLFTYVLTGWEGSAHDSRIFLDTISNPSLNFPKPPPGNYYQ